MIHIYPFTIATAVKRQQRRTRSWCHVFICTMNATSWNSVSEALLENPFRTWLPQRTSWEHPSIHPSIQQPNMKPSQLCLSPLRTRFTFCLNLPVPKVSKMEDLPCSFLHFFHPLDHTFWSLLTGQFGRFTMQRYILRTESRSLARTHQIPT